MEATFELQRWLYASAIGALNGLQTEGLTGLPPLIAAAFSFGMLHALLPGHGKSVLAAYYAGDGRWRGALASSVILIVTHVGSAVLFVLTGFAVLQRTIGGAGRAPVLEHASHVLILLSGLWLLLRALRPHAHGRERSGFALAFVTGMIPCPLTTFIMTYAVVHGAVGAGLILSGTFAVGMVVTVAAFPLLAVGLRTRALPAALTFSPQWRHGAVRTLEIAAALAITAIGGWQMTGWVT
jgi:ABC-type nickel/cobalt efflux system permease component RcnA